MRGFAFSIDMAFGALLVILLVSLFTQTLHPAPVDSHTLLQIRAKDAVMEWFYSNPGADPTFVSPDPGTPHACSIGFRPKVDSALLNPQTAGDWVFQTECATFP